MQDVDSVTFSNACHMSYRVQCTLVGSKPAALVHFPIVWMHNTLMHINTADPAHLPPKAKYRSN